MRGLYVYSILLKKSLIGAFLGVLTQSIFYIIVILTICKMYNIFNCVDTKLIQNKHYKGGYKMALKHVAYKLEESKQDKIKRICDCLGMTQADFINNAIDKEIERLIYIYSGGMVANFPSLLMNAPKTKEQKFNEIYEFNKLITDFSKKNRELFIELNLNELGAFVANSLMMSDEKRERTLNKYYELLNALKGGENE